MIKIHINTILLILLTVTLIVIACVLIRISIQLKDKQNQSYNNSLFDYLKFAHSNNNNTQNQPVVNSDFFKKSITHAENVIKGLVNANEYVKDDRNGSDIIRKFIYLSDEEKQSLLTSINYYQSDPMVYAETEREFRKVSSQKMIPLWISILEDAMNRNIIKDPSSVLRAVS